MPIEVSKLNPNSQPQATRSKANFLHSLLEKPPGPQERMFFTEQLSLLLETGTSLHVALGALRKHVSNPAMAKIIDGLSDEIHQGKSLSFALSKYPTLFPATYINLVAAAEVGGFLDTILLELLNMDEKRDQLRRTVVSALSYPAFLVVFSVFVVIFVLVVVFPKFADMFAKIADRLPASTIILMKASNLLTQHWLVITGLTVAGLAGSVWWLRSPTGKTLVDGLKLKVFGIRDIFIQIYLIQSLRVLGLSLGNGVSVPDALASSREVVSNEVFRRFLLTVENKVIEGSGFAAAFQEADFIPPTVKQMVTTGDETGNLAKVLSRIATYYERELAKKLAALSTMVEPIMLIVMGGVVGLIVSSLILPIFKLSQAVG